MKSTVLREGLFWLCFSLALSFLLFPGLDGGLIPAFRDAFHFYYPLEVWLDAQRERGVLFPTWNIQDAFGASVTSEATSALFYPLRIVWFLPELTVAQRLSVFIFAHLIIAAIGMRYACRRLCFSNSAGCFAAVSYSLSCPIFFQHSNLVYLCSAAWIPWAFAELCLLATVRRWDSQSDLQIENAEQPREPRPSCCVFSFAATLMVLAGDIQAAYHAVLLGSLAIVFRLFALRSARQVFHGCVWLIAASVLIACLSAVQWLPAAHAVLSSDRWANQSSIQETQQVIAEFPPEFREEFRSALTDAQDVPGRYEFSVPPWHFLSLVWPTIGGHYLPDHSRWFQSLAAEGRMWQPSLYVGILPVLFAVQLLFWPKSQFSRWLILVTFLMALAAMGNYGPAWMLRQLFNVVGHPEWAGHLPADGQWSIYWMLSEVLPGYSAFRYPSKWTAWFTCGLALMAAAQFHRLQGLEFSRIPRALLLLVAISSAGLLALSVAVAKQHPAVLQLSNLWQQQLASSIADPWLGLPSADSALKMIQFAALLPLGIALLIVALSFFSVARYRLDGLAILVTMGELVACGHHWIAFVEPPDSVAAGITQNDRNPDEFPELVWSNTAGANLHVDCPQLHLDADPAQRVKLLAEYQYQFQLGKLHLLSHYRSLSAQRSIEPRKLSVVKRIISSHDSLSSANPQLDKFLNWLGVSRRLARLPANAAENDPARAADADPTFQRILRWQPVPNPAPFVELKSLTENSPEVRQAADGRHVQILDHKPTRLILQVRCDTPSRLIIRQYQDGCWRATGQPIDADAANSPSGAPIPVDSYALVFQSLKLAAGDHLVTLVYSPWPRQVGAAVSLLSLVLLMILSTAIAMPRPTDLLLPK